MTRKFIIAGFAGALALVGAALAGPAPATAAEALPSAVARGLDAQSAEFTMTAAKQRRLMIIQNTNRRAYGRGAYGRGPYGRPGYAGRPGYRRGYGPGPGYRGY